MGDETVRLTATCRACGKVAEVGYIHGRARVATPEQRCIWCGASYSDEKKPAPGATKRKGPKRLSRRIAARGITH